MPERSFLVDSPTGAALNTYRRIPQGPASAVLLVLHGLAEHAGRYVPLAETLAAEGYAVYAHDQRGHGSTTAVDAPLRRFAGRGGPTKLMRDIHAVRERAEAEHPAAPVFVLGQSLGGHLALLYAAQFGAGLDGLLAWNAGLEPGWQRRLGLAALAAERALKGSDVASAAFSRATFEAWAKRVPDARTPWDWLSGDPREVDRYAADPLCGWTPTVSMAADVVEVAGESGASATAAALPGGLPVHLLGGGEDPSTRNGASVQALAKAVADGRRGGETTVRILAGARHATLHERHDLRQEALGELLDFLRHHSAVHPKPIGAP